MGTNGVRSPRRQRRGGRIWPAVAVILVLAAVCTVAVRWGLSDLFWAEEVPAAAVDEPAPDETAEPETPTEETVTEEPVTEVPAVDEPVTEEPTEPDAPDSQAGQPAEDDGVWNLQLVNRWNPLPEGYTPELVEAPGGQLVDARILPALTEMLDAATAAELGPIVVAGYRTQEKQQSLYDEKIASYIAEGYSQEEAVAQAEQWVAQPGTSEHQLGLAVDINGAVYAIYPWLQEHSYEYGFIYRYPADKVDLTGVANEEWHYRYVGKEAAKAIYEQGICLEEYLESLETTG